MKIKNGIIYLVTNKVTGKKYVGATTYSIETRKADHIQRAQRGDTNSFQEAIATYGLDSFHWEQVDVSANIDELARLEKKYIDKFDSKSNGYNQDRGGGFKKSIYKYDLSGKLVEKFENLTDAAQSINATKQDVSRAALNVNQTYGGFIWSYDYVELYIPKEDKRLKRVYQYDVDGNLINIFKSVAEASRKTNITKSGIAKACRGERKQSGGYVWKYR